MAVEIREIILQARVIDDRAAAERQRPETTAPDMKAPEMKALRRDILAECARMIRGARARPGER